MSSYYPRSNPYLFAVQRDALRRQFVPKHPENLTIKDKRSIKSAIDALHHLSDVIKPFNNKKVPRTSITPEYIRRFWDEGILDWLRFLFDNYNRSSEKRWEVICYVSCVLAYIVRIKPAYMLEDRCFSLSECLWEDRHYDHLRSEYSFGSMHGWWDSYLFFVGEGRLQLLRGSTQQEAQDMLFVIQNDGAPIKLIIDRLQASFTYSSTSDMEYSSLTGALTHLISAHRGSEQQNNHIVRKIANLVHRVIFEVLPSQCSPTIIKTCFLLFFALTQKLHNSHSIETVRIAIKQRLFESFVGFSKYLHYDFDFALEQKEILTSQAVLSILTHLIPKYILYPSIQRALCSDVDNEDYPKELYGSRAEKDWKLFRELYKTAVEVTSKSGFPFVSLCDNLAHDTGVLPSTLYKCSGCESAWYCSMSCQKVHWNNGHKEQCGLGQKSWLAFRAIRQRDYVSLLRSAILAAGKQWDWTRSISKEELLTKYVIQADYTKHPEEMCLVERNEVAMKAATFMPNATVVQCLVPVGQEFIATLTAFGDIDNRTSGVWFGGRSLTTYDPILISPAVISEGNFI